MSKKWNVWNNPEIKPLDTFESLPDDTSPIGARINSLNCGVRVVVGENGRQVIARSEINSGSVVFAEAPYGLAVLGQHARRCCANCLNVVGDGKSMHVEVPEHSCTDCRFAVYCSVKCKADHQSQHLRECTLIRPVIYLAQAHGVELDLIRLVLAVLIEAERELSVAAPESVVSPDKLTPNDKSPLKCSFDDVRALQANMERVDDLMMQRWMPCAVEFVRFFPRLSSSQVVRALDAQDVLRLMAAISTNCLSVTPDSDSRHAIAIGLFPMHSLLNHSCWPSTVYTFSGAPDVMIKSPVPSAADSTSGSSSGMLSVPAQSPSVMFITRAIQPIQPGQEVSINYIDLLQSTVQRRVDLYITKQFYCRCRRCQCSPWDEATKLAFSSDPLLFGLICQSKPKGEQQPCQGRYVPVYFQAPFALENRPVKAPAKASDPPTSSPSSSSSEESSAHSHSHGGDACNHSHGEPEPQHSHSHGGQACNHSHGHSEAKHQSEHSHSHSHGGKPCGHSHDAHSHGSSDAHSHSHGGKPCGHSHGGDAHSHGSSDAHSHSHGGKPCTGHHDHGPSDDDIALGNLVQLWRCQSCGHELTMDKQRQAMSAVQLAIRRAHQVMMDRSSTPQQSSVAIETALQTLDALVDERFTERLMLLMPLMNCYGAMGDVKSRYVSYHRLIRSFFALSFFPCSSLRAICRTRLAASTR